MLVATRKMGAAIVDVATFNVVKTISHATYAMALNAAGDRVAMVDAQGTITVESQ